MKIPSLKKVDSPDRLYDWLRDQMLQQSRLGKKTVFPSVNILHRLDESQDGDDSSEYLMKRCEELEEERKKSAERIN